MYSLSNEICTCVGKNMIDTKYHIRILHCSCTYIQFKYVFTFKSTVHFYSY